MTSPARHRLTRCSPWPGREERHGSDDDVPRDRDDVPGPATSNTNEREAARAGRQRADGAASRSPRPSTTTPGATSPAATPHGTRSGRPISSPTNRRSSHDPAGQELPATYRTQDRAAYVQRTHLPKCHTTRSGRSLPRMNLTSSVISISLLAQPGTDERLPAHRGTGVEHVPDSLLVGADQRDHDFVVSG